MCACAEKLAIKTVLYTRIRDGTTALIALREIVYCTEDRARETRETVYCISTALI